MADDGYFSLASLLYTFFLCFLVEPLPHGFLLGNQDAADEGITPENHNAEKEGTRTRWRTCLEDLMCKPRRTWVGFLKHDGSGWVLQTHINTDFVWLRL